MSIASLLRPSVVVAGLLILLPMLAAAFFPERTRALRETLPRFALILCPALLCVPYALVASSFGVLHPGWLALYALLPVAIAVLLDRAKSADAVQFGNWRDFAVLVALGLAVDLRWFEPAWPTRMAAFGKMLLLDAGLYGFLAVRQLDGVGFDLRLRRSDAIVGTREFSLYSLIAIPLGIGLGFLHFHALLPTLAWFAEAFLFTFLVIAIPEEVFFRGWLQNLLERRLGRTVALAATSVLFGLSHWNRRTATFNWRYVLMAAIAGMFYGRAWRAERRVVASSLTHALVDTLWSIWLR